MAGDWIKTEHTLPDKPEVQLMASLLNIDPDAVVGKLNRIWIWADQQSIDGNALRVTETFIDRITNCPGFAIAMRKVDWLIGRDLALSFPRFDRHNGQTAKSRALTKNRVNKSRNANTVTETLPEKRREEYNKYKAPRLEEVISLAESKGYSKEDAEAFWRHYEGQGWVTGSGLPVTQWIPKFDTWCLDAARKRATGQRGDKAQGSSPSINSTFQADSVIEDLEKQIKALRPKEKYFAGMNAEGVAVWKRDDAVSQRIGELEKRLKEVKNLKLGIKP